MERHAFAMTMRPNGVLPANRRTPIPTEVRRSAVSGLTSSRPATKKEAASEDAASFVWMPTAVYNRNPTEKRNVSLSGLNLSPPKRHAASHRTGPAMNPQPNEA